MLDTSTPRIHQRQPGDNARFQWRFRDHSDRDEIKRRAEADFLNLFDAHGGRRRGKALFCPFHKNERTAAASIHRGRFHCFGCSVDYDVIDFVQKITNSDFKIALAYLGDRYRVPLNRPLTEPERQEYTRRRAAAEREARDLVDWKKSVIVTLQQFRNVYLTAYHRALRYILQHGLDGPASNLAADACETYEVRYQDLDQRIERVRRATYAELLPLFRSRRESCTA